MKYLKNILLFFIILLITLTYSCKKDSKTLTIKGSINSSDENTADISISILGKKVKAGAFNANFQTLKTGKTDASGNYSIEIEKENISEYKISISKYKYFTIEDVFYSSNFKDGVFSKNYTINPSAEITIIVKNTTPSDNTDFFRYKITSGYINTIGSCSEISEFKGTDIDEEYTCNVIGTQNAVFEWTKAKNGNTTTGTKSVFCDVDSENLIEFYY